MTIAEPVVSADDLGDNPLGPGADDGDDSTMTAGEHVTRALRYLFYAIAAGLAIWLLITQAKARTTVVVGVASIGISAAIWIGANLVFNQARDRWRLFSALAFGIVAFVLGAVISGNRAIDRGGEGFASFIWFPLLLGAAGAAIGYVLATTSARNPRLAVGAGGMAALGVLTGVLLDESVRPEIDAAGLIAWTALVAGIGAAIAYLRHRDQVPIGGALYGAALGWVLGAFGAPDLGDGSAGWAIVATAVPFAIVGVRIALGSNPDLIGRAKLDTRSRAWIFLTPAIGFIVFALVFPGVRTAWLSFLDRDSVDVVWFGNYVDIFQDPNSWNPDGWRNMFFSWPMVIGLALLAVFAVVGSRMRQRTGKLVELGSPSFGPMIIGGLFVAFAVFTALRGTIINNLWWVVVVTLFSTALGLAVAVLADGVGYERIGKSVIFMPMALSLVGASVIWRFMYVARDSSAEQTGVLNALWVGLGRLSTGQGISSIAFVGGIFVIALAGVLSALRRRKHVRALIALGVGAVALAVFAPVWTNLSGDVQKGVVGIALTAVFVALFIPIAQALTTRNYGRAVVPGVVAVVL
ncbi:MAG: hypothetical protein AAFP84_15930, partial [Actinomycetota bacterium]